MRIENIEEEISKSSTWTTSYFIVISFPSYKRRKHLKSYQGNISSHDFWKWKKSFSLAGFQASLMKFIITVLERLTSALKILDQLKKWPFLFQNVKRICFHFWSCLFTKLINQIIYQKIKSKISNQWKVYYFFVNQSACL